MCSGLNRLNEWIISKSGKINVQFLFSPSLHVVWSVNLQFDLVMPGYEIILYYKMSPYLGNHLRFGMKNGKKTFNFDFWQLFVSQMYLVAIEATEQYFIIIVLFWIKIFWLIVQFVCSNFTSSRITSQQRSFHKLPHLISHIYIHCHIFHHCYTFWHKSFPNKNKNKIKYEIVTVLGLFSISGSVWIPTWIKRNTMAA